jgi:hypothetical protein
MNNEPRIREGERNILILSGLVALAVLVFCLAGGVTPFAALLSCLGTLAVSGAVCFACLLLSRSGSW